MKNTTQPKMTMKRPATMRGRFQAAIASLVAMGTPRESAAYQQVLKEHAGKHGKHNGRTKGAFGRNGFALKAT